MLGVVDTVDVTEKNKRKQLYPYYVQQHMKARVVFGNHVNSGVGIFFIFLCVVKTAPQPLCVSPQQLQMVGKLLLLSVCKNILVQTVFECI